MSLVPQDNLSSHGGDSVEARCVRSRLACEAVSLKEREKGESALVWEGVSDRESISDQRDTGSV